MRRRVSSQFAVVVVLIILAMAALHFAAEYRAYEARRAQENAVMQAQAEAMLKARRAMGARRRAEPRPASARRGRESAPGTPGMISRRQSDNQTKASGKQTDDRR